MTGLPRLTITAALAVLLTSLSLHPTLADGTWMLPTILCVAAVAGTGYLARRMSVPRVLIPVVEVGVLVVLLILRFAQDVAVWGVLPGRDVGLETRTLLDEAFDTISSYAPPAPLTPGLVFLLTMSVALVAVVVDTVAVTYRSPALAGLPLLVLYAVPVSVVANGVSWVYFCLAAVGWLALLLADGRERLGGWGRRLGTRTFAGDPTANNVPVVAEPLGAVGRRIGLAAVALAVVLPAIVPGLSEAVFGRGLGAGTGGGGGHREHDQPLRLAGRRPQPSAGHRGAQVHDDGGQARLPPTGHARHLRREDLAARQPQDVGPRHARAVASLRSA